MTAHLLSRSKNKKRGFGYSFPALSFVLKRQQNPWRKLQLIIWLSVIAIGLTSFFDFNVFYNHILPYVCLPYKMEKYTKNISFLCGVPQVSLCKNYKYSFCLKFPFQIAAFYKQKDRLLF